METFNIMEILQTICKTGNGCELGIYIGKSQLEPEVFNISNKELKKLSFFPDRFKMECGIPVMYDHITYVATDDCVWNKDGDRFIIC